MSISSKSTTVIQTAIGKVGNDIKQVEIYQSQSTNPGLVAQTDAAVADALAALTTLSTTAAVVTNGQKITGATGSGTVVNIAVDATTGAVTATLSAS